MKLGIARPDVTSVVYRLFGRPLHPELIEAYAETEFRLENFRASLRICDSGHMLLFERGHQTLCEVLAAKEHPLPQRKQLLYHKVRGQRSESLTCESGLQYHHSFQLEQLDPDVFAHVNEELELDCQRCELAYQFESANRLEPAPLSFLHTEVSQRSLLLHAFHTFPANCAVIKSQTLIEL